MESALDLASAATTYREQLQQVKQLLAAEPANAEYLQLHAELVEVVSLTEELLTTAPQVLEQALEDERQNDDITQKGGVEVPATASIPEEIPTPIGPSLPPPFQTAKHKVGPSEDGDKLKGGVSSAHENGGETSMPESAGEGRRKSQNGSRQILGKRKQMHPRNKYADATPDFGQLAKEYPSFAPYVYHNAAGQPNVEWTDFNASRELTRVLLDHDHGVKWWIPDGQLCPTVTNRANYIHWIEDLLYLSPAPWHIQGPQAKRPRRPITGLDIGVGANCIYPLLGASLNGWKFVGTDVTPVALTWAQKNVDANPHLTPLIEIRSAAADIETGPNNAKSASVNKPQTAPLEQTSVTPESVKDGAGPVGGDDEKRNSNRGVPSPETAAGKGGQEAETARGASTSNNRGDPFPRHSARKGVYVAEAAREELPPAQEEIPSAREGSPSPPVNPILEGVLRPGESFDFCMCNPPFFSSMNEAALNPRTACGGTKAEMVCPGGEEAFVARLIDDSCQLKGCVHWYTSMVGKKGSLKKLTTMLRQKRVAAVETTEFVQGKTSRWGLAWSFTPRKMTAAMKEAVAKKLPQRTKISFTLQRLGRQTAAWTVLQAIRGDLQREGATCKVNEATFVLQASMPAGALNVANAEENDVSGAEGPETDRAEKERDQMDHGHFAATVSVFQQAPGTLLVSAVLGEQRHPVATTAAFGTLFDRIEEKLRNRFKSA